MGLLGGLFKKSRKTVESSRDNLHHCLTHPLKLLGTGGDLHEADYSSTSEAFEAYYQACCKFHGTKDNSEFGDDALEFYVFAVQLASMRHVDHFAWPVMSDVRKSLAAPLKQQLVEKKDDPWLAVAGVSIAGAVGDVELGRRCLEQLAARPDLLAAAVYSLWTATMGFPKANSIETVDELLRQSGTPVPWSAPSQVPPSRRWVFAAGGYPIAPEPLVSLAEDGPRAPIRIMLRSAWGITNASTAADMTGRLLSGEVHSIAVAAILSGKVREEIPGQHLVLADRDAYAKNCALAYDIGRGISVTRSCVAVGYLKEAEGWERLDHAGNVIAAAYTGWDDYSVDYQLGRIFQAEKKNPYDSYHLFLEWLRTDARSPWRELPFGGSSR